MRQKSETRTISSEQVVKDIRRATRKHYSAEDKIRIVLDGLRGEHLARTTGFDIESFIFSLGIGGIGAVLYNLFTGRELAPVADAERHAPRHKLHGWALAVPFVSFPILYPLPWNPIYPAILAMLLGAVAAMWCRPDLARKIWLGALLFLGYYAVFLIGVESTAPGYIERVWNLSALSGLRVAGMPIEELLFAAAFGAYWSSVYDHFTWRRLSTQ